MCASWFICAYITSSKLLSIASPRGSLLRSCISCIVLSDPIASGCDSRLSGSAGTCASPLLPHLLQSSHHDIFAILPLYTCLQSDSEELNSTATDRWMFSAAYIPHSRQLISSTVPHFYQHPGCSSCRFRSLSRPIHSTRLMRDKTCTRCLATSRNGITTWSIAVIWMTQGSAVDGALSFNGCEKRLCAIPGQVYVCG